MSENIKVFVRIRPPLSHELHDQVSVSANDSKALTVSTPATYSVTEDYKKDDPQQNNSNDSKRIKQTSFFFDHVFTEVSTQSMVFSHIKLLLFDLFNGINGTILSYGQTSSGKSYTMIGPDGGRNFFTYSYNMWGIIPRISKYLLNFFNLNRKKLKYEIKLSFLQLYNEKIYDLLRNTAGSSSNLNDKDGEGGYDDDEIKIIEKKNDIVLTGLSEFNIENFNDFLRLFKQGNRHRIIKSTDFNTTSSRSHVILQLQFSIETKSNIKKDIETYNNDYERLYERNEFNNNVYEDENDSLTSQVEDIEDDLEKKETFFIKSKINLVDLAGSEKFSYDSSITNASSAYQAEVNSKEHIRELTSINKSLSALGNVISALGNLKDKEENNARNHNTSSFFSSISNTNNYIPYRDSKLTRILQDSLGGNTRTIFILNVSPLLKNVSETISTLNFGERLKNIKIKLKNNVIVNGSSSSVGSASEIARLKVLLEQALKKVQYYESTIKFSNNGDGLSEENVEGSKVSVVDYETNSKLNKLMKENQKLKKQNSRLMKMMNKQNSSSNYFNFKENNEDTDNNDDDDDETGEEEEVQDFEKTISNPSSYKNSAPIYNSSLPQSTSLKQNKISMLKSLKKKSSTLKNSSLHSLSVSSSSASSAASSPNTSFLFDMRMKQSEELSRLFKNSNFQYNFSPSPTVSSPSNSGSSSPHLSSLPTQPFNPPSLNPPPLHYSHSQSSITSTSQHPPLSYSHSNSSFFPSNSAGQSASLLASSLAMYSNQNYHISNPMNNNVQKFN